MLKSLSLILGLWLAAFLTGVDGFYSFFTGDFFTGVAFFTGATFLAGLGMGTATGLFFAALAGALALALAMGLEAYLLGALLLMIVSILFYFTFNDVFLLMIS